MEGVQTPFLPGIRGPRLAAVYQCADGTGVVHCHLGLHCQLGVGPHSCCEARKGCGCLPDFLVDFHVQREVVHYGGAEVWALMDGFELIIIVMADGVSVPCPRTLVFFRLMVSPKSRQAWEKWSISVCSSCWVWVATAGSSANSMSLMWASRILVMALRRARLKSVPSDLVRR